jgi:hypothetical protein
VVTCVSDGVSATSNGQVSKKGFHFMGFQLLAIIRKQVRRGKGQKAGKKSRESWKV